MSASIKLSHDAAVEKGITLDEADWATGGFDDGALATDQKLLFGIKAELIEIEVSLGGGTAPTITFGEDADSDANADAITFADTSVGQLIVVRRHMDSDELSYPNCAFVSWADDAMNIAATATIRIYGNSVVEA